MPTKRTRIKRNPEGQVTDRAVALYREALPLRDQYEKCVRSSRECKRALGNGHCTECLWYLNLAREFRRELRIAPWQADPLCLPDEGTDELEKELNTRIKE